MCYCCSSSIEINIDDLRPYGFLSRLWNSYSTLIDMMIRTRHHAAMEQLTIQLVRERDDCDRNVLATELDTRRHREDVKRYQKENQTIMYRSALEELKRSENHAKRLIKLRGLAEQLIYMATTERLSTGLVMTLKTYTQTPLIRLQPGKLMNIFANVQKRSELTKEQNDSLQELLKDLDESEELTTEDIPLEGISFDAKEEISQSTHEEYPISATNEVDTEPVINERSILPTKTTLTPGDQELQRRLSVLKSGLGSL